jgi:CheY-like chemotaxis protein
MFTSDCWEFLCCADASGKGQFPPLGRGFTPERRKRSVLIVDDEHLIADTIAEILNDSGFEAVAVYDGAAALERTREGCPDSLIADVIMPSMNGIDLAKRVKQDCPDTKIFLFSGQAATADLLERARAQGYVFELLAKPLRPEILLKKLAA